MPAGFRPHHLQIAIGGELGHPETLPVVIIGKIGDELAIRRNGCVGDVAAGGHAAHLH
jgi:hypothetical protein